MKNNSPLSFQHLCLTKENYKKWCLRMKALLSSQYVWDIIDKVYTKPVNEEIMCQNKKKKDVLLKKRNKYQLFLTLIH